MKALHQTYWQAKGYAGAFSDARRDAFHKQLIASCVADGGVQLLKISTDKECIGYLYNFVKDGIVSNYQGGFVFQDRPVFRPGMLSHYMAIEHNIYKGMSIYDFLAGNHRFKKSLSTKEGKMFWVSFRKPSVIFKIEDTMHKLSHFFWNK
jgi:CelD/BcsL family acetyltransferase involved in cellulose biosynthesis